MVPIRLDALPKVDLSSKGQLPETPAVYFVATKTEIAYIGQSTNIRRRFASHHLLQVFRKLDNCAISYISIGCIELLATVEQDCIEYFRPHLNKQYNPDKHSQPAEAPGNQIKFTVPKPLLTEMLDLAAAEGRKPADLHRIFWESGFATHAEARNKRMIDRSWRTNQINVDSLDSQLKACGYID